MSIVRKYFFLKKSYLPSSIWACILISLRQNGTLIWFPWSLCRSSLSHNFHGTSISSNWRILGRPFTRIRGFRWSIMWLPLVSFSECPAAICMTTIACRLIPWRILLILCSFCCWLVMTFLPNLLKPNLFNILVQTPQLDAVLHQTFLQITETLINYNWN